MRFLKNLFRITPFKLSLSITLFFVALSAIYDMKPTKYALLGTLADKSLDYKFTVRGQQKPKNKIVIVAGDNKSFSHFGQWPWDRGTVFAPLIDTLCKYSPKAVGFDLVWTEPEKMVPGGVKTALGSAMGNRASELEGILKDQSGDALLRKSIENCANRVVLGYALQTSDNAANDYDNRLKNV
ncbi:MAG: CHASE2 domain-containing protein, partial [Deltaproteobacteria bacterium]|nr:CHASE2 domain-containing protein [Deltaproteobacteria bacterium]